MPDNAERKGLGYPATRAGILEKLVSTGFLERKKSKKTMQLLPSHDAVSLITVLPEQLQSPLLTAEWEYRLGEIECGELAGGLYGRDQRHAPGAGENLSGHQGDRVSVHAAPRSGGQMPPLRRRCGGAAKGVLLPERGLQICYLEKQQVVGAEAQAAHQGRRDGAAQRWSAPM